MRKKGGTTKSETRRKGGGTAVPQNDTACPGEKIDPKKKDEGNTANGETGKK